MGRLGKDPELKNAGGIAICNFSVATSKQWKDDSGEKHEKTEWHNCVAFRKTAEIAGKYLSKGRSVLVEGELQTRSWDDKDTGAKKYKTEIVVNNLQFVGDSKPKTDSNAVEQTDGFGPELPPDDNNDIPF